MVAQTGKYQAFRNLHEKPWIFVMPNPWNAGTSRILTQMGFEALGTTSAGHAFSLGRRDSSGRLSREEILENAREIVASTHLPVSADLEGGFGDAPEACAETIARACDIGLAGGSIEDATGNMDDPIYEFDHAVERITAACETAKSRRFLLTARAENFLYGRGDLGDTIKRLQAFSEAGADCLYAPGLARMEDIRTLCAELDKPVNVVMGLQGHLYTVDELQEAGVRRISVGGAFARAALGAFMRAAEEVKARGTFTFSQDAIPDAEAASLMES